MTAARFIQGCILLATIVGTVGVVQASPTSAYSSVCPVIIASPAQVRPSQDSPAIPLQLPELLPAVESRQAASGLIQLLVLITVLSLAPAIIIMVTSFTRIIVVLSLARQALGTAQLPPTQILVGLAILLTILIMAPTYTELNNQALQPYLSGQITAQQAIQHGEQPVRAFMIRQIDTYNNQADVWMFLKHTGLRNADLADQTAALQAANITWSDVPTRALMPAFVISELKIAFLMGFKIYLPFLVIDLVVASILISMGMFMLPPVLVSLPFKILLFVLVDGWHLLAGNLLESFKL